MTHRNAKNTLPNPEWAKDLGAIKGMPITIKKKKKRCLGCLLSYQHTPPGSSQKKGEKQKKKKKIDIYFNRTTLVRKNDLWNGQSNNSNKKRGLGKKEDRGMYGGQTGEWV